MNDISSIFFKCSIFASTPLLRLLNKYSRTKVCHFRISWQLRLSIAVIPTEYIQDASRAPDGRIWVCVGKIFP